MRFSVLAAAAMLAAATPAAANPADAALNGMYEAIAAGVAANSGAGVTSAFADDAMVLDPRPGPPAQGPAFRAAILRMADRLKAEGVEAKADYRVVRRLVSGDIAVDTGYRRQTMVVAKPDGPQPGTQYHKFLVVAQRQPDGRWKIIRDASLPATREAWDAAVRIEGLKYDS
jgi:uncharacterized protein (TIGR02246 family)